MKRFIVAGLMAAGLLAFSTNEASAQYYGGYYGYGYPSYPSYSYYSGYGYPSLSFSYYSGGSRYRNYDRYRHGHGSHHDRYGHSHRSHHRGGHGRY